MREHHRRSSFRSYRGEAEAVTVDLGKMLFHDHLRYTNQLKVEGDTQLLESLFVFSEIFISEIIEYAALFELFEEGVYLSPQFVVTLAYSHRPLFGLRRLQDLPGRILVFSPILKHRHLNFHHTIPFTLPYLIS